MIGIEELCRTQNLIKYNLCGFGFVTFGQVSTNVIWYFHKRKFHYHLRRTSEQQRPTRTRSRWVCLRESGPQAPQWHPQQRCDPKDCRILRSNKASLRKLYVLIKISNKIKIKGDRSAPDVAYQDLFARNLHLQIWIVQGPQEQLRPRTWP